MSFVIFFLALSLMILVHELGHFLVAKKNGLRVEEFGFGYPPRIFGVKRGETIYSINAIPLGGFVKIWGMEEKVDKDKKRAFYSQQPKVQSFILVAGVVMNFLLSIVVFGIIYGHLGVPQKMGKVRILETQDGSPAAEVNLQKDTFIVAIKSVDQLTKVETSNDLIDTVSEKAGQEILLVFESGDEVAITPRKDPPEGQGALGVVIVDEEMVHLPIYQQLPLGIWYGLQEAFFWGKNIFFGFFKMLGQLFSGKTPEGVAGPIGIYKVSSQILQESGFLSTIHFFAVISVNLAVVNLIPIPGTDGWHLSLLFFEKIRGRQVAWDTKRKINQVAMILLLVLFFVILAFDIKRFLL